MALNIVQVQRALQSVPDQVLVGYVQNPNPEVPQYLALAELQRRKSTRQAAQGQQAAAQGQRPSVAQQETAGVAQLPVGGMFNAQNFARGGIVSFADGGTTNTNIYGPMGLDTEWDRWQGIVADPRYKANADEAAKLHEAVGQIPNEFAPPEGVYTNDPERIRNTAAFLAREAAANQPQPAKPPAGGLAGLTARTAGIGGGSLKREALPTLRNVDWKDVSDQGEAYTALKRPEVSAEEAAGRFEQLMGTDEGRAKSEERLAKMEAGTAEEARQAPWMALARAGLGMAAAKSPYALQNIAEGGIEGLKDYTEAKKAIGQAEEKQFELADRLNQSKRAERSAAVQHGLQSEQFRQQHNDTVGLAALTAKHNAELANAKGQVEAAAAQNKDITAMEQIKEERLRDIETAQNQRAMVAAHMATAGRSEAAATAREAIAMYNGANTTLQKYMANPMLSMTPEGKAEIAQAKSDLAYARGILAQAGGFAPPPAAAPAATSGARLVPGAGGVLNYVPAGR